MIILLGLTLAATTLIAAPAPDIRCESTGEVSRFFDQISAVGTTQCDSTSQILLRVRIQASETAAGDFHGVSSPTFNQCDTETCTATTALECVPNSGRWFRARVVARVTDGDGASEVQKLHTEPIEGHRYSLACGGKS